MERIAGRELEMNEHVATEIARILAADSDFKVECDIPADTKITFLGKPILALDSATNNLAVPARFRHHPLVQDRYFCTLPRALWDELYNRLGPKKFDPELVELEDTFSEICGDHAQNAGFWNGLPMRYSLRRRPMELSLEVAQVNGFASNQVELEQWLQLAEERTSGIAKVTRAYAGWLMTNGTFLGELDDLVTTWAAMARRWGFDRLGIVLPRGMFLEGDDPKADPRWDGYNAAFEQFFGRWRLLRLAAPYLPDPLQPLMGGQFPISILPQIMRSGGAFVMPDTFPIPSRDSLRGILEDSLHGATPDHLDEWMAIVASDNTAKKPLLRYSRLFEVQHYLRILHQRHSKALQRKLSVANEVLAGFLGVAKRTIDDDLKFLNKRLGTDWIHRGADC